MCRANVDLAGAAKESVEIIRQPDSKLKSRWSKCNGTIIGMGDRNQDFWRPHSDGESATKILVSKSHHFSVAESGMF